jgi:carbamoyl-phosphate synthase large subunit
LTTRGVATWLPPAAAVALCLDKWKFARVLTDAGIATPATGLGGAAGIPGPWIVKPRFGRGSRDVYPVEDPAELTWACRRTPDPIVQTAIAGQEFTADVLVDRDGRTVGCVPRWRLETKAGISTKGETFDDAAVSTAVARTVDTVGLHGSLNLQGFVDGTTTTVVEVNPRFSGGLPLSLAAGADLVGEYLRGMLGAPIRIERLEARAGVRMTRYFAECFES